MRTWRLVHSGGFEMVVGGLLAILMLYSVAGGRIPVSSVIIDLVALAVVIVAQRWLRVGMAASFLVIAAALVIDPFSVGVSLYLCILPVVTALRKEQFPLAIVSTIVNATAGTIVSLQLSGDERDVVGSLIGWAFLYGIAWAVGLGMRAMARDEAARVRAELREHQLTLAWELHESVVNSLAALSQQLNVARHAGTSSTDELKEMAEQAQLATQSVREISQLLGGWDRTPMPDASLRAAATEGMQTLRRKGYTVQANVQIPELPRAVEQGAARIIQEALHNVAEHGSKVEPCVLGIQVTADALELSVTNRIAEISDDVLPGLGLTSMRHRAGTLGGEFSARRVRGSWICRATLPLS